MLVFIIQTALLLAIAYILGCLLGCLFRSLFGHDQVEATPAVLGAGVLASAAPALAMSREQAPVAPAPAPVVAAAPVMQAPPMKVAKPKAAKEKAATKTAKEKPVKAKTAQTKTAKAKSAKPKAAKAAAASAPPAPDDLKRIRGIGRQNEARLNSIGVVAFSQIAKWSTKEQAEIGEKLAFPGRIEREDWVSQAKLLASGKETEFSKRVAKGEVETSLGPTKGGKAKS
jgi:NADH-quinone oxidoreductase subunit E